MDMLFIEELHFLVSIGDYTRETFVKQRVEISLEMTMTTEKAGQSDDILDAVDYTEVVACLKKVAEEKHFRLIEHLAEKMASALLANFPTSHVRLSLSKLGVLPNLRRLGFVIERTKELV